MDLFDAIRPYNDAEVPAVLARLSKDRVFLDSLIRFRYPALGVLRMALLRPLLSLRLQTQLRGIRTIAQLQAHIEPYINRTIERSTAGISWSGIEHIEQGKAHLFIANHRDIVMDPAFANYALYKSALPTLRIAIGDNLLQKPFVADLMRLNKSFIVQRSLTGRREKLAAFQLLSAYINHSIRGDNELVWIAQAEGRAKDGDDRTDPAILKMFHLSCKEATFSETVRDLRMTPLTISYEYDPCDIAKARELYIRETTGQYLKAAGEDDASIALGITGFKGRVHVHFGAVVEPIEDAKELAAAIDKQIWSSYRLFPVNYLAYADWQERDDSLNVPPAASLFAADELKQASQEWQKRLAACEPAHRPWLIRQYATPLQNHYRFRGCLPKKW